MGFVSAVKSCLVQYAGFSGRATRSEYWWFFLFYILVLLVIGGLLSGGMLRDATVLGIAILALLLPMLAVSVRRLHDVGRSGWWLLLTFTGFGDLVLLYWFVQPSAQIGDGQ